MATKINQNIIGEVTFVKDYVNKAGKPGKSYTVGFIGGTFYGLFLKDGLQEMKVGDKGVFEIECKLTNLKDEKGYNKTAYVPVSITDFASEVKQSLLKQKA